jgi:SAM-dependent methyltransferase
MTGANPAEPVCPACGGGPMRSFFRMPSVPVFCNVLHESRAEALAAPRADIELGFCAGCGMIYNLAFDPRAVRYSPRYENALDHSPVFREYAEGAARRLVERYDLRGATIVEIGCGQGVFLGHLCAMGGNEGLGFDPSFDPDRAGPLPPSGQVRARRVDLVCCRHVLEHLERPRSFLEDLHRNLEHAPHAVLFFEVPNALWTIEQMGVWDVIYEHCSYFTPGALRCLFGSSGFAPLAVDSAFGGQFLTIEARAGSPCDGARDGGTIELTGSGERVAELVEAFGAAFEQRVCTWRRRLARMRADGSRAVVWGAGSKGVTFLNLLAADERVVSCVVDVNPHKHGRYIAGTGQPIIASADLPSRRPTHVIVMNPIYEAEIRSELRHRSINARILTA